MAIFLCLFLTPSSSGGTARAESTSQNWVVFCELVEGGGLKRKVCGAILMLKRALKNKSICQLSISPGCQNALSR